MTLSPLTVMNGFTDYQTSLKRLAFGETGKKADNNYSALGTDGKPLNPNQRVSNRGNMNPHTGDPIVGGADQFLNANRGGSDQKDYLHWIPGVLVANQLVFQNGSRDQYMGTLFEGIKQASELGSQGNYTRPIRDIRKLLKVLPPNESLRRASLYNVLGVLYSIRARNLAQQSPWSKLPYRLSALPDTMIHFKVPHKEKAELVAEQLDHAHKAFLEALNLTGGIQRKPSEAVVNPTERINRVALLNLQTLLLESARPDQEADQEPLWERFYKDPLVEQSDILKGVIHLNQATAALREGDKKNYKRIFEKGLQWLEKGRSEKGKPKFWYIMA